MILIREGRTRLAHVAIASMNLHCGVGTRGQPFDVEAAILGLAADVIALQETWFPDAGSSDPVDSAAKSIGAQLLRVPIRHVDDLATIGIPMHTGPGTIGIALLTTLPATDYDVIELRRVPGDDAARHAQIATLDLPDGSAVRIAGTHLTYRLASPVQLAHIVRHLSADALPTVIAGDLNMPRHLARLAPGYTPIVRGRTWPAELPIVQLDHVLASRGVDRIDGAVQPPAGSDHLPVRASLWLPG